MEVEVYIDKLKKIIKREINKRNYENAFVAAKTLADIYYSYNQIYTDLELEDDLLFIRDYLLDKKEYATDNNCVLFYDGFGLDLRGWAASYVRAITKLGYKLIYMCPSNMKGNIPHILGEMDPTNSSVIYLDTNSSYVMKTEEIDSIFKKYTPGTAFFYTTPYDVCAAVAFSNNSSTTRIQIDLTDHAYWIGVNAFDYITECREMGASLAVYERNIEKDRIVKLDCAPYINYDKVDDPYPFDIYSEKYVFTGGALYKTLGDKQLLYYKTVRHILEKFEDIKFLYAGTGDTSEIEKLKNDYPQRVFHINERSDFYEIIKNCCLYLNSYPMFGGLMMRYAAMAGKIPITLKHGNDSDGLLINQASLGIEFENYDEYINEIDRLILDETYRHDKEKRLKSSVYDEDMFARELNRIIIEHKPKSSFNTIERYDTTEFRREYKKRFDRKKLYMCIVSKSNASLIRNFPIEFTMGALIKMKERILK